MNKFSLKTALSMIGIDNENRYLFLAFFTVLLSRLPFLNAGYGLDADSWRVIHSARLINLTGQYTASRLPGYPLQEYVLSLFWRGGPFACNLITAVLSSFSFLFFALSLKKLQSRDYIVGALALAFTPIVYINSTTTRK